MVNQNDYDSNHNEIYMIIWTFVGLESLKGVCKYVKGIYWYLHVYVKGKQTNNSPFLRNYQFILATKRRSTEKLLYFDTSDICASSILSVI